MPERLTDLMDHEMQRWSYMTDRQLHMRISKMRKLQKLLCCYVVASERGRNDLMQAVESHLWSVTGERLDHFAHTVRQAARIYHQLNSDRPAGRMSSIRPAEDDLLPGPERVDQHGLPIIRPIIAGGRTTSGLPNAQVVHRYRDPVTGRSVASVDLVAAAQEIEPPEVAFPPEPHDTETCSCAMCKSMRVSKWLSEQDSLIRELTRQISAIKKEAPKRGRRIRFKRRKVKFAEGWRQPLLGGE